MRGYFYSLLTADPEPTPQDTMEHGDRGVYKRDYTVSAALLRCVETGRV
jgi:hypothetical protein